MSLLYTVISPILQCGRYHSLLVNHSQQVTGREMFIQRQYISNSCLFHCSLLHRYIVLLHLWLDCLHLDGSVQDCSISIANALEIPQFCTNPSICSVLYYYNYYENLAPLYLVLWIHLAFWAPFQYKDHLSWYMNSHCKDQTVVRLSYLHNGNSCTCKMTSLYWDGPLCIFEVIDIIDSDDNVNKIFNYMLPCCICYFTIMSNL